MASSLAKEDGRSQEPQVDRILDYIGKGKAEGATAIERLWRGHKAREDLEAKLEEQRRRAEAEG